MILWLVMGVLTFFTVWLIVRPLMQASKLVPARADYDLEVYRDQLAELERDVARGVVGSTEAEAARREIARRILSTDMAAERPDANAAHASTRGQTARRVAALGIAGFVPILAFFLYLVVGAPGVPDFPFAERATAPQAGEMPDIGKAITALEAQLKEKPDNLEGWLLLARSYAALKRFADAADAYHHVMTLSGDRPDAVSAYAEMRVMAAQGEVNDEVRKLFETVHAKSPADARASFYLGLAKAQRGDGEGAIRDWLAIEAAAPPDAPFLRALRAEIARVAQQYKLDPATLAPSRPAPPNTAGASPPAVGPSAADIAASRNMTPAERDAMIKGMVERLAARLQQSPDDLDGWRRLGRAYRVIGEPAKAIDALAHAAKLAPDNPDVQVEYGSALLAQDKPGDPPSPEGIAVMRRVLTVDATRREALWYVGLAEAAKGDKAAAATLWQRLLGQLKPDSAEYKQVKDRLDGLGAPK